MKSFHLTLASALIFFMSGIGFSMSEETVKKPASAHSDHKGHDDHADHKASDDHKGHDDHDGDKGHVDKVKLTPAQIKELGIEIGQGTLGTLSKNIVRPAVVKFDQERVAHIVPRVSGVVHRVFVSEGDRVNAGDVIAIIESRELAKSTAEYIARHKRLMLMVDLMKREEDLKQKNISRLRDFLEVKTRHGEAEIEFRKAQHNLLALGLGEKTIAKLLHLETDSISAFKLIAPLSGIVTHRHVVRGEYVSTERQLFVISNMKNVWVDITIYPRDLGAVKAGQEIRIKNGAGNAGITSRISFVSAGLKTDTRTAIARAIVANKDGQLYPGMYLQAHIYSGPGARSITVPESAIQKHEGKTVVFVANGNEFSTRQIVLGKTEGGRASVLSGLKAGERIVSKGGFVLRAQLAKSSFGDGHNH